MDLWVTGPDGEKVFYSNQRGKAGGTLDVDVTDGYGPETYTQARLQPGYVSHSGALLRRRQADTCHDPP